MKMKTLLPALLAAVLYAPFDQGLPALAQGEQEAEEAALLRPIDPAQADFFEKKIRPALVKYCFECHSPQAKKLKGGLRLDHAAGVLKGGNTGKVVVPGKPEKSPLVEAIRWKNKDLQMPPEEKLPEAVIADLERWIAMGVPWPSEVAANEADAGAPAAKKEYDTSKARSHWAYQPVVKPAVPAPADSAWSRNDIDRFILAGLEKKGLKPAGDADRRTLIRRATFDLVGLPPSPEEVEAFAADTSPDAFEKVVDRLLESPRYGERWGRHWLDLARFAESNGKGVNALYTSAWRYRDYVIAAFNEDKPYDRFLREQIAGDLLPARDDRERAANLTATGFLALGPKSLDERNPQQFRMDLADEQIDTMSQAMLGVTIACARCHDHKFDPISQREYYAVAGIFLSTETLWGTTESIQNARPTPLVTLPFPATREDPEYRLAEKGTEGVKREIEDTKKSRERLQEQLRTAQANNRLLFGIQLFVTGAKLRRLDFQLNYFDSEGKLPQLAMGVKERAFVADAPLYQRGEVSKPGERVPRGFVSVITKGTAPSIKGGSGRLELAEWLAAPENPLTGRVMVNRLWHHLFGKGLVRTVDNFGVMGDKPTHPELLDHLAVRFRENGGSVKKMIREIVLSRAYRMGSSHDPGNFAVDPENDLVWRVNRRRLDAESIRDAMLAVSGRLDLNPPRGSAVARAGDGGGPFGGGFGRQGRQAPAPENCRSVYLSIVRDRVPEALEVFDFAGPEAVTGSRESTNVPSQALYLMNSAAVMALAERMAERLEQAERDGKSRLEWAYRLALSRPPSGEEEANASAFFANYKGTNPWAAFCQALLACGEFRYVY